MRHPALFFVLTLILLLDFIIGNDVVWLPFINRLHGNKKKFEINIHERLLINCYLITPNNKIVRQNDSEITEGISFQDNSPFKSCRVTLGPLDNSFQGNWTICGAGDRWNDDHERCQTSNIIVEDSDVNWLPLIERSHINTKKFDITLPHEGYDESCYLITPYNSTINKDEAVTTGSVEFSESSYFVSCRVTVGPIDKSFQGYWTLCGVHGEKTRCQPNNVIVEETKYPTKVYSQHSFAVSLDGYVTFYIQDKDNDEPMLNCFLTTPLGEQLILTPETNYNRVEYQPDPNGKYCTAKIGPFNDTSDILFGNWAVHGTVFDGEIQEISRHNNIYLYDEKNPHAQPFNITTANLDEKIINLGINISIRSCVDGLIVDCLFKTPAEEILNDTHKYGKRVFLSQYDCKDNKKGCQMLVKTQDNLQGDWELITKSKHQDFYNELRQPFRIKQEDPAHPKPFEYENLHVAGYTRNIVELGKKSPDMHIATSIYNPFKCYIKTPSGLEYRLMEGFNVNGVEIQRDEDCKVTLTPLSTDHVGNWTLILREEDLLRETHFYFYMDVLEYIDPFTNKIMIAPGNNFHLRFKYPFETSLESCKLIGPDNLNSADFQYDVDVEHVASCGFIVRNASKIHSGTWTIEHKEIFIQKAQITIELEDISQPIEKQIWAKYIPKNQIIGTADLAYCRIKDSIGSVLLDEFGKCEFAIDQVTDDHNGTFDLELGYRGNIKTQNLQLSIIVEEKPNVVTTVNYNGDSLFLSCSVASLKPGIACRFHSPSNDVFLATPGLEQDRYQYYGEDNRLSAGVFNYSCGIQIKRPNVADEGSWKCALQIENGTYFGFLHVTKPNFKSAGLFKNDKALEAHRSIVKAVEGSDVVLSCTVNSRLRYCYFISPQGKMYTLDPDDKQFSTNYIGHGLESGECGLKIRQVSIQDNGQWSCHGATFDDKADETAYIQLLVEDAVIVKQYRSGSSLLITAEAYDSQKMEYCRFVRADRIGFPVEKVSNPYLSESILEKGLCVLHIREPKEIDFQPWTVVAKIKSRGKIISKITGIETSSTTASTTNYDKIIYVFFIWNIILSLTVIFFIGEKVILKTKNYISNLPRDFDITSIPEKKVKKYNINQKNVTF